jgi:predicted nucleic acid-binding protein
LRVISDTSPLILLAKIGRLELLFQLYGQVVVPVSVLDEIRGRSTEETTAIESLVENQALEIQRGSPEALERVPADLGAGEREAIALAMETEADIVVLDDREGRRVARERDLPVTGTIGILIEARARDMILSVRRELDRLIEAGMWIDEAFYHRILHEFDE